MNKICELITDDIKTVAVVGHVNPDGDCAGSVLGLSLYLKENFPDISVTAFLEELPRNIAFLNGCLASEKEYRGEIYDLCVSVDCSDEYRIGAGKDAFSNAVKTACIDHHGTNRGFAGVNHVVPGASSAAEVLFDLFEPEKISLNTAVCLYTGIVTDTGCFQYSAASPDTLRKAAMLMEKGIDFPEIIRVSLTEVAYKEARIASVVIENSRLYEDGFLYGEASLDLQEEMSVSKKDMGGIVSELNKTAEAKLTMFLYQLEDGTWKGSLRSKGEVNAADLAAFFGGGGHVMAAGFSLPGKPDEAWISDFRRMAFSEEYRL